MKMRIFNLILVIGMFFSVFAFGQTNKVRYIDRSKTPVLKQLREDVEAENAENDSITSMIQKHYDKISKDKKDNRKVIRPTLDNIDKPKSLDEFKQYFHFDPVAQYYSGMCWCYSATSFLESEVKRISGLEIKLSELHTVYYEYLEKIKRVISERGNSEFGEGSESNAVLNVMDKYGAVPAEVFTGLKKYEKHNHIQLFEDMQNYLTFCEEKNFWDEEVILATIKAILDKYIGTPPKSFEYEGKNYTPLDFYNNVLKIKSNDYCGFMSTMKQPFYKQGIFDVPDNWWRDSSYYNIPLDEWYSIIKNSIKNGYTVTIGGDVSEAGLYGEEDIAIIPDFDIPAEYINQDSREYRIYNGTTEDDHGIHLVGYTTKGWGGNKNDWFLIKDSGRSSRRGQYKGYYMFRDDFIRLKMLTFMVHKDMVKDVLSKINK